MTKKRQPEIQYGKTYRYNSSERAIKDLARVEKGQRAAKEGGRMGAPARREDDRQSRLAHGANTLREWAAHMTGAVAGMPDDDVIELARQATELETRGFLLRGACVSVMKRRIRERVARDPSSRGNEETTVRDQLDRLAREIGVHARTLDDDCRIYETFGEAIVVDNNLPREVYRLALSARDPGAAVEMYTDRKDAGGYSTLDFRRDISELNRGVITPDAGAGEHLHRMFFDFTPQAVKDLKTVMGGLSTSDEQAIFRALRYTARHLEEDLDGI